jgi:hypothetical protein
MVGTAGNETEAVDAEAELLIVRGRQDTPPLHRIKRLHGRATAEHMPKQTRT